MIRNWDRARLGMDFSGMYMEGKGVPSDIDMCYLCSDGTVIFGEIKNECGTFSQGQKMIYETLAKNYKNNVVILFIIHDKYVEKGDTIVDVANCKVREYFWKGNWYTPKNDLLVKEVVDKLR